MDGRRFDEWTAALAGHPGSRRALTRLLAGGALASVLTRLGFEAAAACAGVGKRCGRGRRCCAGARCVRSKCRCKAGLAKCGGDCVDLQSDPDHCKECGRRCSGSRACVDGVCDCTPLRGICDFDRECCRWHTGAHCEQDRPECALFQPPPRVCCLTEAWECRNDCDCCPPLRCVDFDGFMGKCNYVG